MTLAFTERVGFVDVFVLESEDVLASGRDCLISFRRIEGRRAAVE